MAISMDHGSRIVACTESEAFYRILEYVIARILMTSLVTQLKLLCTIKHHLINLLINKRCVIQPGNVLNVSRIHFFSSWAF